MKDLMMTEMMTKEDVTAMILSAKKQAGLTWEEIADKIGMSPVWTHSASMGMNAFPPEKAKLMVSVMGLPQEAESVLAESPTKIWEQAVPTDPCIYRFYATGSCPPSTLTCLSLGLKTRKATGSRWRCLANTLATTAGKRV